MLKIRQKHIQTSFIIIFHKKTWCQKIAPTVWINFSIIVFVWREIIFIISTSKFSAAIGDTEFIRGRKFSQSNSNGKLWKRKNFIFISAKIQIKRPVDVPKSSGIPLPGLFASVNFRLIWNFRHIKIKFFLFRL